MTASGLASAVYLGIGRHQRWPIEVRGNVPGLAIPFHTLPPSANGTDGCLHASLREKA